MIVDEEPFKIEFSKTDMPDMDVGDLKPLRGEVPEPVGWRPFGVEW